MAQVALRNHNAISAQSPMLGQALQDVVTQLSTALSQIAALQAQVAALQAKVGK